MNSARLSRSDYLAVSKLVHELTGIHFGDSKRELVVARLGKRMRQLGLKSVGDYLSFVEEQRSQEELIAMLDALSTNLTSFWREAEHFEFVASHILPGFEARHAAERPSAPRVWSAGCSTGEEPYGLAMLMLHHLSEGASRNLKVLATDLSTRVLGIARTGVYGADRVQKVPPAIQKQFLEPVSLSGEKAYRVTPRIRERVNFARLNLMDAWPMKGPFDIIFCRNVMIYFDKPTQARLVGRFHNLLNSGGYLFVGHSESLTGVPHYFRYVRPTIYEKA